jgi:hypothetical protein
MPVDNDHSGRDDLDSSRPHNERRWDQDLLETWGRADLNQDQQDGSQEGGQEETAKKTQPGWVSWGGILRWEESEDGEQEEPGGAASEATSHWASDTIDLPPGAPDRLRVRSLRAWLLRQRSLESEEMGQLLLERRRLEPRENENENESSTSDELDDSPLALALAERQAAIEVYEALVESLDEMATHTGPSRLLVEYYLWLNERLVFLGRAAEAPKDFAVRARLATPDPLNEGAGASNPNPHDAGESASPPTARSIAEWQGRTQAALEARRRIEQVSAPEPED